MCAFQENSLKKKEDDISAEDYVDNLDPNGASISASNIIKREISEIGHVLKVFLGADRAGRQNGSE